MRRDFINEFQGIGHCDDRANYGVNRYSNEDLHCPKTIGLMTTAEGELPQSLIRAIDLHPINKAALEGCLIDSCDGPAGEERCEEEPTKVVLFDFFSPEENRWTYDNSIFFCDNDKCWSALMGGEDGILADSHVNNVRVISIEVWQERANNKIVRN